MGNSWCCGGQPSSNDGSVLDRVISQASNEDECLLYRMANYKKGGELIDAYNVGGQAEVEKLIKEQFGVLMYAEGRGQVINRAEYLRWKFRDQDQVVLPIEASLSAHDPLGKWEDHEACWQMQYRGSLGESLLHVLIICDSKLHTRLARTLLKCFPKQALDVVEGEDYLGASALHLAIAYANNELVQDLIEAGANVTQRAIGSFFLPRDQQLARPTKTTDYEGLAYLGEFPLAWAACCANESVYNLLLDVGADPDMQDSFGNMILHMVVVTDKLDMFGYALRHPKLPAKNGIANTAGLTPLTLACKLGRATVFQEMLELSAKEFWRYSNITCSAYPLNALDTLLPDGRTNWNSALFIILNGTKEEHLDMLDGGIIQRLLEEKWKTFARNQFLKRLLILALHLFTLSMAVYLRPEDADEPLIGKYDGTSVTRYGFEMGTIASVVSYVVFQQGEEIKNQGLCSFIKQLPHAPAKAIFLVSNLLILACIPFRLMQDKRTEEAILLIAVPGSWFLLMFFAGAIRLTGPFVTMVYSMITGDMLTFGIIYTVVLFGFSQSFFFLYKGYPGVKATLFHSYPSTWMALFQITLGDYNYAELANLTYPTLSKTVFAIFMVLVPILLLNMLIAMMGNTYAHVIEQSEKEWVKQWAKIVVTLERAVNQADAHHYLQEYSIKLGPGDDPSTEQRGVMVIKSKSKTRAKQRKGAVMNWKRVGKVTIKELHKRGMTGEQMRRLMWERASISTPVRVMSPDLLDGIDSTAAGFGGLSAALDVMAFTNDLSLPSGVATVTSPTSPFPPSAPPATPILPAPAFGGQKPSEQGRASNIFSQLTGDLVPCTPPPAYPSTPPPAYPLQGKPPSIFSSGGHTFDYADPDPMRQLVLAADMPQVDAGLLAELARRAGLVDELQPVSPRKQHEYCCPHINVEGDKASRKMSLECSDSDAFGDGIVLGRGSRLRRARSARHRSAATATTTATVADDRYSRYHRQNNHVSSSDEGEAVSGKTRPVQGQVAQGQAAQGQARPATAGAQQDVSRHKAKTSAATEKSVSVVASAASKTTTAVNTTAASSAAATATLTTVTVAATSTTATAATVTTQEKESGMSRSKPRPKTAKNRVAPSDVVQTRRGHSAAVQSVRPHTNGNVPRAPSPPPSPPDPLDSWSTKDIANMNSLLKEEEDSM